MNFLKLLYPQVSSLTIRIITLVTVGLASATFRAGKHSFFDNIYTGFRGGNGLKALHKFLAITIICTTLVFGMAVTPAEASEVYVRKEAHSPTAQEDIKSLKIALAKMRQMDCSNPLSWYYQGAIHWVPTGDEQMKNLESNPLCSHYTKSAHKLLEAWDDCTHTGTREDYRKRTEKISDRNFLVWHRFYLYHFENVVRALSGNENFAMPYWGYVSLNSSKDNLVNNILLTMPEAFRNNDKDNSIYEDARSESLLNGEEIESELVKKILYKNVGDLNKDITFFNFNSLLEGGLHGFMHDYIGGSTNVQGDPNVPKNEFNKIFNVKNGDGLMADVESAGFDPIFWMHHGNIDRLWDKWTSSYNKPIRKEDLCEQDQCDWEYKFYDPEVLTDGTIGSKLVQYSLQQVMDKVYNLGYHYDDTPKVLPPSKRLLAEVSKLSDPPKPLASQKVDSGVGSDSSIDLNLPLDPQMETKLRQLTTGISTPTATKGYTLKIDVTYTGRPRGSYDVFLNLPEEKSKSDIETYYAGSISFFVIPSPEPITKTFQFDITDELLLQLQKLGDKMDTKNLLISIRKASGNEDKSVKFERVSLYSY